ncbi:transglycosylase SLT domain-containing protein [Frankia sp. CNm7]|uniref:Transglycosylase SLT domain-containing protein n=1 Tax=Frankia nepalensis TaxID=1836974 RepID=A0A937RRR2_9ACTN|nr:transglycosylase SLT domain-containing protein [Frankia nepalensis]MBL7498977.1 transglycosylase SLT domain-containing protein [Frankia nepalensis]MBL7511503.1 transglycosylase SLT domain-containing protein [Frankia nepalensis]MBL7520719.1 transglycosylase SLT domain-containing protein [Frankia nepalensis]MBL7630746.1 transglycosylase SLT domain-containing protein [Frankia nepalensis]
MSIRRTAKSSLRNRLAAVTVAGAVATGAGMMAASPASAASDVSIAHAAKNAGLSGCRGVPTSTWVAIALAESGGNSGARLATSIEDSRGLWQINTWAHPWTKGKNLYDVSTNAAAAKKVCSMQGPTAWSTYTNGAYTKYLSRGHAAAAKSG